MTTKLNKSAPVLQYSSIQYSGLLPIDNAVNIPINSAFSFQFNQQIKAGAGYLTLNNGQGDVRHIALDDTQQVQFEGKRGNVVIHPSQHLLAGSEYVIQIDPGAITNATGEAFAGITDTDTLNFKTEPLDITAPLIQAIYPLNEIPITPIKNAIILEFNEPVYVGVGYVTISDGLGDTRHLNIQDNNQVLYGHYINGILDTLLNHPYTLELDPGIVTDLQGNPFAGLTGNNAFTFKPFDPVALSSTPADGLTNVPLDSVIAGTFNEAIKIGSGSVTISNGAGDTRRIDIQDSSQVGIDQATGALTINPTEDLWPDSEYTVQWDTGIVTDLTGNPFAGSEGKLPFNFRTKAIPLEPIALNSTPADDVSNVPIGSVIAGTFNKPIKAGSGFVTISNNAGDSRHIDIQDNSQVHIENNTLTIDPLQDLRPNSEYTVQWDTGIVTDLAGNPFAGSNDKLPFNFKTETIAPIIMDTYPHIVYSPIEYHPIDALAGIPIESNITLVFNEAIKRGAGYVILSDGLGDTRRIAIDDAAQVKFDGKSYINIDPTQDLLANSQYTLQLDPGIVTDEEGHPSEANSYTFRTQSLELISISRVPFENLGVPAPELGIPAPLDQKISGFFNKPIKAGSGYVTLSNGTGDTRHIDINDSSQIYILNAGEFNIVDINPTQDLLPDSEYTITWDSGIITDLAGHPFGSSDENLPFTFKTVTSQPTPREAPLTLVGVMDTANPISFDFNL